MPVPSQECVGFQLFRWLKTQMVELLIGFVCFCGLSLLNAPWSTVPLLLPLFGSCANKSGVMSCRCSFRDIQGLKRPNTINVLFQILLSYFEELKKTQQQQNRTYSEPPPYRRILEKIMLAKTKYKNLWKFYWNPLCCLGKVMDNATLSFLYCIVLYENYITLNDKVQ